MINKSQNDISAAYFNASNLAKQEKKILKNVTEKTGFIVDRLINKSSWWTSPKIGALHYLGTYRGKRAVLKIQGVKPNISEGYIIESFIKTNKSKIIRPPYLYKYLPWDEKEEYEALVLEFIDGPRIIQTPAKASQIKEFFELYLEYKKNCLNGSWFKKPETSIPSLVNNQFKIWRKISFKIYPEHPLRKKVILI